MELVHYVENIPMSEWKLLGSYVLGGVGVSVVLQAIRHKFQLFESQHTKWVIGLLTVLSLIASAAAYLINHQSATPYILIPHFSYIMTAAFFVYHMSVNPLYEKLINLLSDAGQYRAIVEPQQTTPKTPVPPAQFEG
jgi:hypothetical protein